MLGCRQYPSRSSCESVANVRGTWNSRANEVQSLLQPYINKRSNTFTSVRMRTWNEMVFWRGRDKTNRISLCTEPRCGTWIYLTPSPPTYRRVWTGRRHRRPAPMVAFDSQAQTPRDVCMHYIMVAARDDLQTINFKEIGSLSQLLIWKMWA